MSTEMLAAVSDLTAVIEEKVVANTHEVRRAVAEVLSVKALLAAKAATESVPEREYRRAWLEQVVTKDTTALRRLVNEYKEVLAAPGASGGYGIPRVTAEAAVAFMGTICPWTDLCGVEEVTSGDYREPVLLSHTGSVGFEGETDTRDETGRGTWISVAPTWGGPRSTGTTATGRFPASLAAHWSAPVAASGSNTHRDAPSMTAPIMAPATGPRAASVTQTR